MPTYSSSWLDKVVVQLQAGSGASLRALPNSSGTWTNAGAVLDRHSSLTLTQNKPVVPTPYKTGDRSTLVGAPGRRSGSFSYSFPIIPNGAAGTKPDMDPIFQAVFGQAGTVVASTSVTYSFLDTGFLPIALIRYNKSGGSSPTNFLCGGAVVQRLTLNLGGEYLTATAEGKAVFVSDSTSWSEYTGTDAVAAFGLSAFPAEPSGLTVNGSPINGFGGTATFDGQTMAELRGTPSIIIATGLDFAEDGYADGYPFAIVGGRRQVSCSSFRFADNDGSALNNVKQKAFSKSPIAISLSLNTVAGSTFTVNLNHVQMGAASLVENGNLFDIDLGDTLAHEGSAGAVDDCTVVFS